MSTKIGKLIAFVGLGILVYSGYQAMTYRETLRLTQQEFEGLPLYIVLILAAGTAISILGGFQSAGTLKPISIADAPQPTVLRPHIIDFVKFNHRGPLLTALKSKSVR